MNDKRMDPDIKAEWVAALRSGDYEQGVGQLSTGSKYCCLGVLCELTSGRLELEVEETGGAVFFDGQHELPPEQVVLTSGLPDQYGTFFVPRAKDHWTREMELTGLNDDGMPFDQIADIIDYFM